MTFRILRMGLLARVATVVIGGLELSFPHPDFWGGKKGWSWTQSPMTNDLIKQGFVTKLS